MADREIEDLRLVERQKDIGNRIADSVVYQLQAELRIDNAALMRAYTHAFERFGSQYPPGDLRAIVDRVATKEAQARQRETLERNRRKRRF